MSVAVSHPLHQAIKDLNQSLAGLTFPRQVACVYNPLEYAIAPHLQYLQRYGTGKKRTLFLGMNPGPWGMVQTGVPFGEVSFVRDWLEINAHVAQPTQVHPKRPIQGFDCQRTEVSGLRFWGLMAERFPDVNDFFSDSFVVNYCPLVWMTDTGKNITPDKLPKQSMKKVYAACDQHLLSFLKYFQPEFLVGIGAFAEKQLIRMAEQIDNEFVIGRMLHPSPASPVANRCWPERAISDLNELGVW